MWRTFLAATALTVGMTLAPVGVVGGAAAPSIDAWELVQRLLASEAVPAAQGEQATNLAFYQFGDALATDGESLVVRAKMKDARGELYLFTRSAGEWVLDARLEPPPGARGFGSSLDVHGDTLVVGAPFDDTRGPSAHGAVYVYLRQASSWALDSVLTGGLDENVYYGHSVAAGETGIAVMAPFAGPSRKGIVYVYERADGQWALSHKVDGTQAEPLQTFTGRALALDGSTLAVGAQSGKSTFVYERTPEGWSRQQHITDGLRGFGHSIDLDGDRLIVGAGPRRHVAGAELPAVSAGAVHTGAIGFAAIYERAGGEWTLAAELDNPRRSPMDWFGSAVAVEGDLAVVAAESANPANMGAVYLYSRTGDGWHLEGQLLGDDTTPTDAFGWTLDLSGGRVYVGAPGDDQRSDGSPPPLDDEGDVPPCVHQQVMWGCDDGDAAGAVYVFEQRALALVQT